MAYERKLAGAATIAALLSVSAAHAQTIVGNVWPVGSVLTAIGTTETFPSSCSITGGPASLTTGTDSFMSLSLVYAPPTVKYGYPTFYFGSAAHLVFNTARSGVVEFDNYYVGLIIPPPPKPKAPIVRFYKYTSVVSANPPTLNVSFDLTVGDCTVPVTGIFHQP
jgi:hypothetical protein